MAGLAAALVLAGRGLEVDVFERSGGSGGKLRQISVGATRVDAGPTVFTMRSVFDELFADAGTSLDAHLRLHRTEILARHAWSTDERLDLFADTQRSAAAIGEFAGAGEAHRFLKFCRESRAIFNTLEHSFIRAARPTPLGLIARVGWLKLPLLWRIRPFTQLWSALGSHFRDPRLQQLFGRYATYCGSSPFAAPATLMLVAHVEQDGVWFIEGGMQRLADAIAHLAEAQGVRFHYNSEISRISVEQGRANGVYIAGGGMHACGHVIANVDSSAIAGGLLGAPLAGVVAPTPAARRSLSAVTWALEARADGFPLLRHNVFFSRDCAAEFRDIFDRGRPPEAPTVYVCAQDRDDREPGPARDKERLLCLINAPATGDGGFDAGQAARAEASALAQLQRSGLTLVRRPDATVVTTPTDFARLFPGTGGALYGPASHGWRASFARPGSRTRVPGLYLAGGSVHPGPGLPMAALSGRLAAAAVLDDA